MAPDLVVRVGANLEDLKKDLDEGTTHLEAMTASAIALQTKLVLAETAAAAAGVTMKTLAAGIVEAGTATDAQVTALTAATAKFLALKGAVVGAKEDLAALRPVAEETSGSVNTLHGSLTQFDGLLSAVGLSIHKEVLGLTELGEASGKTASELGAVATAGLAVGTAFAAYELTKKILEWTGLDQAIGDATVALYDFGLAEQTEAAISEGLRNHVILKGHALGFVNAGYKAVAMSAFDVKEAEKELTESAKASIRVHEAMAKAMLDLDSVGDNWHKTLDRIDGSVVEAIKYYLAAGVSQQSLAVAYGLTAEQIHSVADARKEDIATCQAEEKILAEFEQAQIDQSTSETAAIEKVASAIDGEADSVHTLAGEWISAAAAKASFDQGNTLDVAHAARDPEIMNLLHMGWSLENAQAIQLGRQWGFTPKLYSPTGALESQPDPRERVPGYVGGVQNAPGGWAMVGERGPELVNLPRGSDVYPNGTGPSGGTTTIAIYVNGTGADVARQVMAEITRTMKQTRQWPAA